MRPKTTSSGTQSSTRMEESEIQTRKIKKTKGRGSQATEDRSEEIEQLRYASELEKQTLIDQHAQNVKNNTAGDGLRRNITPQEERIV